MRLGRTELAPDLAVTAVLAIVAALVAAFVDVGALRVAATLPLVFVLPGYAVSRALLPARRSAAERALLAVGLSLATAVVAAVVADRLPWRLTRGSWALALLVATLAGVAAAAASRPQPEPWPRLLPGRSRRALALAAVVVAGLASAAVVVARVPVASRQATGYSVLWTRPAGPGATTLAVGVASYELHATRYRVVGVDAAGTFLDRTIELRPHQRWRTIASARVPAGFSEAVQVVLYRADEPRTPYRHVSLTLPTGRR